MSAVRKYRVVDLFAGCGGLSRGLERTGRFSTDFAVEILEHPASTLRRNLRASDGEPTRVFAGDIEELVGDRAKLWDELSRANLSRPGDVDLLVGGPPCQGFSRNGVRKYSDVSKTKRFYDEPRNHLYKAFLEFVAELRPRAVLIENVREFLNADGGRFADDLLRRLDELGYAAEARKLCAVDYGVPQTRWRAFVLAVRDGLPLAFPSPKHDGQRVTVRDAIADLPAPLPSHADDPARYRPAPTTISDYACLMRSGSDVVHNHIDRPLTPKTLARVQAVGHGRMRDAPKSVQTRKFYGSAYARLWWDRPSLTITTWVYSVGSGRFAHPQADRGITMREAARLQSFDDDFVFPSLINPVSQMIGNAVPPLLGAAFGEAIARALDDADLEPSRVAA